jgi:hypothetical protein
MNSWGFTSIIYKLIFSVAVLTIPIMLITACTSNQDSYRDMAFDLIFAHEDTNNSIQLSVWKNYQFFKLGTTIDLAVKNLSNEIIVFPPNYNVRIFHYSEDEKQWMVVEDSIESPSEPLRALAPQGSDKPNVGDVIFHPNLETHGSQITIRVTVTGNVVRDDIITDEQVGAYIDIVLHP